MVHGSAPPCPLDPQADAAYLRGTWQPQRARSNISEVEHPFYLTVGHSSSRAFKPAELLEVQLRDWIQWFIFAKRHRHIAWLLVKETADARVRWERDASEFRRVPMSPMVHDQMMMLMGFAVENLAKGALIGTMTDVLTKKGRLHQRLATHDVLRLVRELGITPGPEHQEFLRMAKVMVSGPNARYPARSSVGEPILTSSSWSLGRLWERFEEVFELLALALLDRNEASVQITMPQYQDGEQCVFECTRSEWLAWELQGRVPPWLPIPPTPTNPWCSQLDALRAASETPSDG